MREAKIQRKTNETDIEIELNLDGKGVSKVHTGIGFLDHMLDLMTKHGFMDLNIKCIGDNYVDDHHSVEDIGILLGKVFKEAIGDKKGIARYSTIFTPMDEALSMISIDISGRPYLEFNVNFEKDKVGNFDTELVEEFFRAFAYNAGVTLHINIQYGKNTHHIIESIFKGFGRAINNASQIQDRIEGVLSTKGIL